MQLFDMRAEKSYMTVVGSFRLHDNRRSSGDWPSPGARSQTMEQIPFATSDDRFAENPEPRCACVLLLDVSGSMAGTPIMELNAGLTAYKDELAADSLASKRVEVAIVTFGGSVQTVCDFTTADAFHPPVLTTGGD